MRRATINDLDAVVSLENACFKVGEGRDTRESSRRFILSRNATVLIATDRGRSHRLRSSFVQAASRSIPR